jgi:hypothetical protein
LRSIAFSRFKFDRYSLTAQKINSLEYNTKGAFPDLFTHTVVNAYDIGRGGCPIGACEPAEHFDRDQNYSNLFLGHASLYILGDYRLNESLKALA